MGGEVFKRGTSLLCRQIDGTFVPARGLLEYYSNSGFLIGTEIWIPRPMNISINGKVSICKDLTEYQAEINKKFRRILTFLRYYNVNSFTELSIGIGIEFTYHFKYQRNEY